MKGVIDVLLHSGIFGLLALLSFIGLFVSGVVVLSIKPSRHLLRRFVVLSCIPLVLGLCGTVLGYRQIAGAVEAGLVRFPGHPDGQYVHARREARYPSYLGLVATMALLAGAGAGSAFIGRESSGVTAPPDQI